MFDWSNAEGGWWRSVTAEEVRNAESLVERFLSEDGPSDALETEAFARALALHQLFDRHDGLSYFAGIASHRMLEPNPVAATTAREAAIQQGFLRALRLLGVEGNLDEHPIAAQLALSLLLKDRNDAGPPKAPKRRGLRI